MLFRAALMVASALTSGAFIGRSAARREIDRRVTTLADEAAEEVRLQIRHRARDLVAQRLRIFAVRTLVKTLALATLCVGYLIGLYGVHVLATALVILVGILIAYDLVNIFPTARLVIGEIRKHGFRPRTAIGEAVAAHVFQEVLEEVDRRQNTKWHEALVLRLAGRKKDLLIREIAERVSEIARQSSWRDLRPFILSGAVRMALLTAIYTIFAWGVGFRIAALG